MDGIYTVMANQGYRRTNFEEDEYASAGGTPTSADFPPAQVTFKGGISMPPNSLWGMWAKRTTLENRLFIVVGVLSLVVIIMAAVLSYKDTRVQELKDENEKYCSTPQCVKVASTLLTTMDSSYDPCDDFYKYACGGWIKANPIPPGHSQWNTFDFLGDKNEIVMKNAIDKPLKNFTNESERKAKKYFESCMDAGGLIEKAGAQPLLSMVADLGWGLNLSQWDSDWQLPGVWNLHKMIEDVQLRYINTLFNMDVAEDDKNSSQNILQIDQGILSLSQDNYLNKSIDDDKILSAYLQYMKDVYKLLGAPNETFTEARMREVIQFEMRLANITIPDEEKRDEKKNYHKYDYHYLTRTWPQIDWFHLTNHVLDKVGLSITLEEKVVVLAPRYLTSLNSLLEEYTATDEGKKILTNYMLWQVVERFAVYLSKPFRDARTPLNQAITGQTGNDLAWHECIRETNVVLGFALGALFVKESFKGGSKLKAEEIVEDVRHAFTDNLKHISWMDEQTKSAALDKAYSMHDMIGFPDYIMDGARLDKKYKRLSINASDYFGNNLAAYNYSFIRTFEKLRKAPVKNEWSMTPSEVNAYYAPNSNTMVFPVGILQAPFYSVQQPKSLNYGAIGVVMGHELTHGFDDQGREFDKYGNLKQWWHNKSIAQFKTKAQCFVDQYSSYQLNGENVRGKQTLGENIADNGGIKTAFTAYRGWVKKHGEEKLLPGLGMSHNQVFFLGFAQVWCRNSQKESDHLSLTVDSHSPQQFRVIGTLSNSREFADAFKCKVGSPMNPKKKCEIW